MSTSYIDKDISLALNDIHRDISLAKNDSVRYISLAKNDISVSREIFCDSKIYFILILLTLSVHNISNQREGLLR